MSIAYQIINLLILFPIIDRDSSIRRGSLGENKTRMRTPPSNEPDDRQRSKTAAKAHMNLQKDVSEHTCDIGCIKDSLTTLETSSCNVSGTAYNSRSFERLLICYPDQT